MVFDWDAPIVSIDQGTPREQRVLERLGEFIVFSSVGEPAEVPDSVSIIGGAPDGEPQPMPYFDARGVKRLFMELPQIAQFQI